MQIEPIPVNQTSKNSQVTLTGICLVLHFRSYSCNCSYSCSKIYFTTIVATRPNIKKKEIQKGTDIM